MSPNQASLPAPERMPFGQQVSLPTPVGRSRPRLSASTTLKTQIDVLWAVMLHDIKSRFFGNGLGYVVTILWPSAHIAVIVVAFIIRGAPAPYGDSRLLWISIGVLPYICWNYVSRFTMLGVTQNKNFLSYPIVKFLDLVFARQALEMVSICIITAGLLLVLSLCDITVVPNNIQEAVFGLLSSIFLGIGFGVLNGVIVMIFPLWNIGYILVLIVGYLTSGAIIDVEALPHQIGEIAAWNPLLHCVEWIKTAYYPDFPAHLLDKGYVLAVAAISLTLGLILERALKRFML